MSNHFANVALGLVGQHGSIEVQAESLDECLESERSVELVRVLPVLERQKLNLAIACVARRDEVGFLRKQKPMFDLTDQAAVAVMGHELMIAEAAGISDDDQAAESQRTIADAVLQDIGGIRRFALLMKQLSTETAKGKQLDDKLFEISGYDAARARLFPAETASGNSSKSAKRISPSSFSPPRKPRFGIWHCPRCNVEWTRLLNAEDVCATCGSALDDVRPSVIGGE